MPTSWSREEVEATVADYLAMPTAVVSVALGIAIRRSNETGRGLTRPYEGAERPGAAPGDLAESRRGLRAIGQELVEATDILDGLVRYRFGEDTELMAAWASARNVFGPVRRRGQVAPEGGKSGAGGEVSPAA